MIIKGQGPAQVTKGSATLDVSLSLPQLCSALEFDPSSNSGSSPYKIWGFEQMTYSQLENEDSDEHLFCRVPMRVLEVIS